MIVFGRVVNIEYRYRQDTIDDTFVVSISAILSCWGIESSIDDTFMAVFPDTLILILLNWWLTMFTLHAQHLAYRLQQYRSNDRPIDQLSVSLCNALTLATHGWSCRMQAPTAMRKMECVKTNTGNMCIIPTTSCEMNILVLASCSIKSYHDSLKMGYFIHRWARWVCDFNIMIDVVHHLGN